MKCFISIGKFPCIAYFYMIVLLGLKISHMYIRKIKYFNDKETEEKNFNFIFLLFIAESFSIFIFLYRFKKTKNSSDKNQNNINKEMKPNNSNFIIIKNKKNNFQNFTSFFPSIKKDKMSLFIILIISICDFFSIYYSLIYSFLLYGISGIFGLLLFNRLFKCQTYKHHYLTLFILTITSIAQIIILINYRSENKNNRLKYTMKESGFNIISAFMLVSEKYLIEKKNIDSFIILFLEGIFGLIFSLCFFLIKNYNDCFTYFKNFSKLKILKILQLVLYVIIMLFNNVIKFLLSENTPSIYNLLSYNISIYLSRFYINFQPYFFKKYYMINFILNIINVFAMLIFIEIIIFHCCGLDYNCRENIEKRENDDKTKFLMEENSSFILYKEDTNDTTEQKI